MQKKEGALLTYGISLPSLYPPLYTINPTEIFSLLSWVIGRNGATGFFFLPPAGQGGALSLIPEKMTGNPAPQTHTSKSAYLSSSRMEEAREHDGKVS